MSGALRKLLLLLPLGGPIAMAQGMPLGVERMRCEYLSDPMAVESGAPRLSWTLASGERGQRQTAYRILAASHPSLLERNKGDLWDSGKRADAETIQIPYGGKPLASRQQVYWKVRLWDERGRVSPWSETGKWSMGLLQPADWKAEWISYRDTSPLHASRESLYLPPARHYRKNFETGKPVRRAVLYASALGIFDAYVNGRRVSEAMFAPGWSDYTRRSYYRAWDVTGLLSAGGNTLGATVAEGWYSGYVGYGLLVGYGPNKAGRYMYGKTPALIMQLEIEYADGSHAMVATGPGWETATGPALEADILMGETYDARKEPTGWEPAILASDNGSTKAVFWDAAGDREVELGFRRPSKMQAYPGPDIRPIEEIKPVAILNPAPETYVFNMGQNFSGVARLKVKGPAGARVQLRFAEMVYPEGRIMTENLRKARATDSYILRGDPEGETWAPRFTYHGFQYVEVTGYPGRPDMDAIMGIVVHSDTPLTSRFESSDPMTNRLFRNIVWTQRSNFVEIPTDCPQRDERLGWTGDAQIYARTATINADTAAFYTKWLDDLEESQRPNGAFPDYAPYPMQHGSPGIYAYGTAWMDAGIIVPYGVWKAYGDVRALLRHWGAITRFMEFRRELNGGYRGSDKFHAWGDWLAIGSNTPIQYIDAAYYAYDTRLMAEMAAALDKGTEAAAYRELYQKIRGVFQADFVNADGTLKVDTQTAYVLALSQGLFPEPLRQKGADRLAAMIRDNSYHMTTGFLGTSPLLPVLSASGHHDLAARLFQSREFPGWGYEVENGATTIWERWNSYTKENGFFAPAMNSYSHYSFGAVGEWMFRWLAGIDSDGPGYRRIVIRPGPPPAADRTPPPIRWVTAEYDSIRGRIASKWSVEDDGFHLEVTIPPNTTAVVMIPAPAAAAVNESGRPAGSSGDVRFLRQEDDRAVFAVKSGSYRFQVGR